MEAPSDDEIDLTIEPLQYVIKYQDVLYPQGTDESSSVSHLLAIVYHNHTLTNFPKGTPCDPCNGPDVNENLAE